MAEIRPQRVAQEIAAMTHLRLGQQEQKQIDGTLCAPLLCRHSLSVEMASKCTKGLDAELGGGGWLVDRGCAAGGCKFHVNPPWCGTTSCV